MARLNNSLWHRHKYKLNALVLILPCWFFYQSLAPEFPALWPAKQIGAYEISPMPFDLKQPYMHDESYVKDFMLIFKQGDIAQIRQAYLNIGAAALPLATLQAGTDGILHGSQHGQHVHAIAPEALQATHKGWLTIENWQGEQLITSWNLPDNLLAK